MLFYVRMLWRKRDIVFSSRPGSTIKSSRIQNYNQISTSENSANFSLHLYILENFNIFFCSLFSVHTHESDSEQGQPLLHSSYPHLNLCSWISLSCILCRGNVYVTYKSSAYSTTTFSVCKIASSVFMLPPLAPLTMFLFAKLKPFCCQMSELSWLSPT